MARIGDPTSRSEPLVPVPCCGARRAQEKRAATSRAALGGRPECAGLPEASGVGQKEYDRITKNDPGAKRWRWQDHYRTFPGGAARPSPRLNRHLATFAIRARYH